MRRWFLSHTSQDLALTQALQAALKRKDPDAHIFFAPGSMRAGPPCAELIINFNKKTNRDFAGPRCYKGE
jgi:hypothetical protein